jgi:dihydroxyacid dehydratase/phosphogluconate dehydratase
VVVIRYEGPRGGPIAALSDGDTVVFDIEKRRLDMEVLDAEIRARMAKWKAPEPHNAVCSPNTRRWFPPLPRAQ